MKKFSWILALFGILSFQSCIKEDQFGLNNESKVLSIAVSNQAGNAIINNQTNEIRVVVSAASKIDSIYLQTLQLSTLATANISVGEIIPILDSTFNLIVTAENGSKSTFLLIISKEGAYPQLAESHFDNWYTTPKGYQEPGLDQSSTIWATGNAGTVTLGSANVSPITIKGLDNAAKLVTLDLGSLAGLVGQRIGAGSLFSGKFELDIANPLNSTKFGVPFSGRPKAFKVDYAYQPGTPYLNNKGVAQNKSDSCDIFLLLENRSGSEVKRVATGWFRSGENKIDKFYTLEIPLTYGDLGSSVPDYMKPANGMYAGANETVTHITVVFSSSYNGANFEGGTNSTLVVNNLNLVY